MTTLWKIAGNYLSSLKKSPQIVNHVVTRNMGAPGGLKGWTDWRMIKDFKKREMVREHAWIRRHINCIKKNKVLPLALRSIAAQEIDAFPRDVNKHRVVNRCMITSRPRGILIKWRLSRIAFRNLADYNHLSGCKRAIW